MSGHFLIILLIPLHKNLYLVFLFLEKELEGATLTRAATKEEIEDFRLGNTSAFHLGYGTIGGPGGVMTINDGKPYLVEGIVGNQTHPDHIPLRDRHLNVIYPFGKSIEAPKKAKILIEY